MMYNWEIENIFRALGAICAVLGFAYELYGLAALGLYWLTVRLKPDKRYYEGK